jgi:hypothetical protein
MCIISAKGRWAVRPSPGSMICKKRDHMRSNLASMQDGVRVPAKITKQLISSKTPQSECDMKVECRPLLETYLCPEIYLCPETYFRPLGDHGSLSFRMAPLMLCELANVVN